MFSFESPSRSRQADAAHWDKESELQILQLCVRNLEDAGLVRKYFVSKKFVCLFKIDTEKMFHVEHFSFINYYLFKFLVNKVPDVQFTQKPNIGNHVARLWA